MDGRARSVLTIEPRFHEIDMLGVVHNSVYFKWFEQGRLDILQRIMPVHEAMDMGISLPVVENHCKYKRPVRFGDKLVLVTTMLWSGSYQGKITFEHELTDSKTKGLVALGTSLVTVYDYKNTKLVRNLPDFVLSRIDELTGGKA